MPHLVKKGFLTTCLTTDSFGTHGNSGVKRCGEYAETSRNYRKWPEIYRKNLVQPFGSFKQQERTIANRCLIKILKRANALIVQKILSLQENASRPRAADAAPGREAFLLAEMGDGAQKLCASEHPLRPFVR